MNSNPVVVEKLREAELWAKHVRITLCRSKERLTPEEKSELKFLLKRLRFGGGNE